MVFTHNEKSSFSQPQGPFYELSNEHGSHRLFTAKMQIQHGNHFQLQFSFVSLFEFQI
tara:strand:+ start:665 stop:838 length:174 start_codon:yes stop_codon:yes gene_type:complete